MPQTKPFDGLRFCCTGILSHIREDLAEKIETLGGTHYSDLMSDVNYLIVGERATAKYNFCIKKRHDIKFIVADTVSEVYDLWLKGEDEGSKKLDINTHLMPVFDHTNVCFSRIEFSTGELRLLFRKDLFRYKALKKMSLNVEDYLTTKNLIGVINKHGGKCTESLTLANTCVVTTEKAGRRYNKATEWKKPVVHPIWIFDSIVRGGLLNYDEYNLGNEYNGCDVWNEVIDTRTKPVVEEPRIKLQKNTEIWNSIMENKLKNKRVVQNSVWDEEEEEEDNYEVDKPGVEGDVESKTPKEQENQLFLEFNFLLIGFSSQEATLLTKVISNHGGDVTSDTGDDSITHVMVPASKGTQSFLMLRILSPPMKAKITNGEIIAVTEWFVERSMFYNRTSIDRWGQPMKGLVPSTRKFNVCITGFTGIELLHVEKLIRYLNFEFCESLTSNRDLLVVNVNLFKTSLSKNSPKLLEYKYSDITDCPTFQQGGASVAVLSSKNKINAAKKWQIPVVSVAYLWEIMELSSGKPKQVMPNIMDLTWCLFAPRTSPRAMSLMEYNKNMDAEPTNGPQHEHSDSPSDTRDSTSSKRSDDSDSLRLPSPRKAAKRQKYGQLAGLREALSLTNKLQQAQYQAQDGPDDYQDEERMNFDVTNDDDDIITQVGYQNTESARNDQELLKKLGDDGLREQPARRPREVKKPAKYTK
ncbi:uncharacterized protein CANTADRAFT_94287 [Suhomyces tanzawaensis NRRL Y-17324]|uniref:BRCT domain-containing protein n=1 Tax=Suhomyces tanzawaensis NRRL Y-17324 TaxID=984487 RepID=A0A1E4SNS9_9ASCO|nr:uncharacterized protein CANTADRAFT_94287 [Suhomyces tanzawaensis NRRL Y-17324]ODV81146.1 hypothetical protein CANTADRAFT_94287 [Suhomyces tanzawaensis NRRL Y-17324]